MNTTMKSLPGEPAEGSLVLYRSRPARVRHVGDKLEIEVEGGEVARVRPKDVTLLHPGPLRALSDLQPPPGDVQTAWELLAGTQTTLPDLAELIYGAYTPASAWATWQLMVDGLYFRGGLDEVTVRTPAEVARVQAARDAEAAEKQAWGTFLERLRAGQIAPEDGRYLREVEALALKESARSRVMRELGREETAENAHALLLELGHWDETVNPYPRRLGLAVSPPDVELPPLPDEARADLTYLPAFAIDDEGSETPDDAVSLEGSRLWVHVADVAALVRPAAAADLEARARGASLHLPESVVPMLPASATPRLGLGLAEVSPALSFGIDLGPGGQTLGLEIVPAWVQVTRLTYEAAETRLDEEPFQSLYRLAQAYQAHRQANGAVLLDFPEVRIWVQAGQVNLRPLPPLRSRMLVQEAMIMAGEAVARFAQERDIPMPYNTQEASELGATQEASDLSAADLTGFPPARWREPGRAKPVRSASLSEMAAVRRTLKRSQYRTLPAPHAAMGLAAYVQTTSPLRRYPDLVAHQQVRAYLRGERRLEHEAVLERIGAVEAVMGGVRQAEQLSDRHWTLVYLRQHPGWHGEGVVIEQRGPSSRVLIPDLALEVTLRLPAGTSLDSTLPLVLSGVNLAQLEAYFRVQA
jgi:exoribonuclease-2